MTTFLIGVAGAGDGIGLAAAVGVRAGAAGTRLKDEYELDGGLIAEVIAAARPASSPALPVNKACKK
jgi:hypothetical protein